MYRFEDNILGKTDDTVLIERSEENAIASLSMAKQSERTIDIVSRDMDPAIYDSPEFVEAAKQMVLKNKMSRIRILAHEPALIVRRGHRLVDLAMQLTSFIEIRVPSLEHADFNDSLFIADTTGYIHRLNPERYEGKLNFNDKRTCRILAQQFDEMWGKSRSDPNFKRTLL
jgi:hypothetical protein